ncbi:MAG: hypothetical protein U0744_16920 [Gemmataceae bacterium]
MRIDLFGIKELQADRLRHAASMFGLASDPWGNFAVAASAERIRERGVERRC